MATVQPLSRPLQKPATRTTRTVGRRRISRQATPDHFVLGRPSKPLHTAIQSKDQQMSSYGNFYSLANEMHGCFNRLVNGPLRLGARAHRLVARQASEAVQLSGFHCTHLRLPRFGSAAGSRPASHAFTTVVRLDGRCLSIPLTDSQRFYDAKSFAGNSSTFVPDWRHSDTRYMLISLDTRLQAIYRAHV